jgi:hypothetical protein
LQDLMRAQITILVSAACLLLCGTPLWARGGGGGGGFSVGGSSGGGGYSVGGGSSSSGSSGPSIGRSDSKSANDSDSGRGSGGSGKGSSGGGFGKGSSGGSGKGGGSSNKGSDRPNKPDRADSSQQRADREGDRKQWPGGDGRDGRGGGGGHHQPPCPRGHHDCNKHCCNHYGYGGYGWGWGYGGYGFPDDVYDSSTRYEGQDKAGVGKGNVELKLSPKNVEVYVNGVLYGTKGNSKISLPTGMWTIEIRAEGYLTETVDLEVKQGIKYKIERKLQRDPNYRPPDRDDRRTDA